MSGWSYRKIYQLNLEGKFLKIQEEVPVPRVATKWQRQGLYRGIWSGIRNVGNGLGKWDFTSQYKKSGSRNLDAHMYAPELITGLKSFRIQSDLDLAYRDIVNGGHFPPLRTDSNFGNIGLLEKYKEGYKNNKCSWENRGSQYGRDFILWVGWIKMPLV